MSTRSGYFVHSTKGLIIKLTQGKDKEGQKNPCPYCLAFDSVVFRSNKSQFSTIMAISSNKLDVLWNVGATMAENTATDVRGGTERTKGTVSVLRPWSRFTWARHMPSGRLICGV